MLRAQVYLLCFHNHAKPYITTGLIKETTGFESVLLPYSLPHHLPELICSNTYHAVTKPSLVSEGVCVYKWHNHGQHICQLHTFQWYCYTSHTLQGTSATPIQVSV